jgi:hypothetical protein
LDDRITAEKDGVTVSLPHPIHFGIHKLIISTRRSKKVKAAKDFVNGCEILYAVIQNGGEEEIQKRMATLPSGWKKSILESFKTGLKNIEKDVDAPRLTNFNEVHTLLHTITASTLRKICQANS